MTLFFAWLGIAILFFTIRIRLWKRSMSTFITTISITLFFMMMYLNVDCEIAFCVLGITNFILIIRAIVKEEGDKFWHRGLNVS